MANDHRLDIYVDAITYMALRARSEDVDRTISQHVRNLIRADMEKALAETKAGATVSAGGIEGE